LACALSGCLGSGGGNGGGRLSIGLSEANPHLLEPGTRAAAPFAAGARELAGLRFTRYRLLVSWAAVQPRAGRPPAWEAPQDGCLRAPPCASYGGVRAQLRALEARRPRPEILVTFLSTPDWAAAPPSGCEDPKAGGARARVPSAAGLQAYRELVRSLLGLAAQEGVELKWWSPWNEPNAGFFLGPQRARCDQTSETLTPAAYARLARALEAELAAAPGDQRLVLGDLSAAADPRPLLTAAGEWAAALPRDVACASDVWALHRYVGDRDVLGDLLTAVDARGCPRRARVWITETGVGGPRPGQPRAGGQAALKAGCRAMDALLRDFRSDPRVDVAIQYSAREDSAFPVGLLDPELRRAYPALDLWKAWSREQDPPLPQSCR
jgi:hypothetical protein